MFLPPVGTSPHVMASLLLHFFYTLPEPLLTFKYSPILPCPQFIHHPNDLTTFQNADSESTSLTSFGMRANSAAQSCALLTALPVLPCPYDLSLSPMHR